MQAAARGGIVDEVPDHDFGSIQGTQEQAAEPMQPVLLTKIVNPLQWA